MARQIFLVDAQIVDANGVFHHVDGYPKSFDSNSYENNIQTAQYRAEGEFSEVWGGFCKRDDRQIQTVMLYTVDGFQLDRKTKGTFPADTPAE